MSYKKHIPKDVQNLYDIYEFKHASTILAHDFPEVFQELIYVLRSFRFTEADAERPGGNKGPVVKKVEALLKPLKWKHEQKLTGSLTVGGKAVINDTHKVDHIKDRVVFDVEWNSKDQTFDRDLYAFRHFFEFDAISVGIILTRSEDLVPVFKKLGINKKYGKSTTHTGKLLPRLKANRNGGCPVLVFAITPFLLASKNKLSYVNPILNQYNCTHGNIQWY